MVLHYGRGRGGRRVVRKSVLKDYTKKSRRRRTALTTRVRMQRPTARKQQRQILSLATQVARNTKYVRAQKVYTDYQFGDSAAEQRGISQSLTQAKWYGWKLTDFDNWNACMRRDQNVAEASRTYCLRMQINCRLDVGDVSQLAYINLFIVTLRKDAVNSMDVSGAMGNMTDLSLNDQFVEPSMNQGTNVRLNPAIFKVHAAKYVTLTPNAPSEPLPTGQSVGNPYATWRKWQWNIPLKFTARMPNNESWDNLVFEQMPYYQRYYLIAMSTHLGGTLGPTFQFDSLATCVNF